MDLGGSFTGSDITVFDLTCGDLINQNSDVILASCDLTGCYLTCRYYSTSDPTESSLLPLPLAT